MCKFCFPRCVRSLFFLAFGPSVALEIIIFATPLQQKCCFFCWGVLWRFWGLFCLLQGVLGLLWGVLGLLSFSVGGSGSQDMRTASKCPRANNVALQSRMPLIRKTVCKKRRRLREASHLGCEACSRTCMAQKDGSPVVL